MKKLLFLISICGIEMFGYSQQSALGTWQVFNSYRSSHKVTDGGTVIYSASPTALMYVEKEDNSIHSFNKANFLSDDGIATIGYNDTKKALLVAYGNSNLDLIIDNKTIYNIPDIKNKLITGSKTIHSIIPFAENFLIASDIGVSVLNIERKEISNTYVIGNSGGNVIVHNVAVNDSFIFAATAEGLKKAKIKDPFLQNYANWELLSGANGLPAGAVTLVEAKNDFIATVKNDSLYTFQNNAWNFAIANPNWDFVTSFYDATYCYFTAWNEFQPRILQVKAGVLDSIVPKNNFRPFNFIKNGDSYWLADEWFGLNKYATSLNNLPEKFIPNCPVSNASFDLAMYNNVLYMAPGGIGDSYLPSEQKFNGDGIAFYKDKTWTTYERNSMPALADVIDLLSVAPNPKNNKVYFGSHDAGLVEFDIATNTANVYNADHTPTLVKNIYNKTILAAVACDQKGNVWMHNKTNSFLAVKAIDGQWARFTLPNTVDVVRKIMIDSRGYIWTCQRGDNIIVYDPGSNALSNADDRMKMLMVGEGQGALPDKNVWCMVEDLNGDIWVGTDVGIGTFYCGNRIFESGGCDADKIKVERDGYIGYLFATESVRAIAVDGANRKWVGSNNGVWLISEDGKTELLKFNTSNSPIPSNVIKDIAIDQNTGIVYIATENGLASYQGDAILGTETKGTALVYPNPVSANFEGNIAIKGLVQDAYVKITDAAGILVYQGQANGSQFVWDGRGYTGNKVKPGVYVVYAATDLGKERSVAKIVIQN